MDTRQLIIICVLLAIGSGRWTTSRAEPPGEGIVPALTASYAQRISQIEAELAALKHEVGDPISFEKGSPPDCGESCAYPCDKCDCDGDAGFYTGAALVFAKPHFKEAFQLSVVSRGGFQQELLPFLYDYSLTPRIWLGYTTSTGLGIRADYWQFDQAGDSRSLTSDGSTVIGAHAVTIIIPATILAHEAGETLTATDSLKVQVINLMATVNADVGGFSLVGAGGLRYASLTQSLSSVVTDAGGVPIGLLNWSRVYEGLGPAIAVSARRPIGCRGLTLVAEGGGALLFGRKDLNRFVVGNVGPEPIPPLLTLNDANEVVPIGDVRLGLEWNHRLPNDWQVALQGLYEGQLWAEAGAPTLGFLGFEGFSIQFELRL